ncbi:Glutaredoxin [Entomophthora muscae]|uniref:Glutaredoxin n=2 Tax=Entomophthora muscae TaxID=34485 RepID=A0ACC2SI97_9FUNG|nr:Glutaredoxin [Entomophthora muscae]KAJ9062103.1 Glutaredoxin [Entomophthora muscae]
MAAAKQIVEKLIVENTLMIFSKSTCPYCTSAKDLAKKLNVQFMALEINKEANGSDIQAYLKEKTKQSTVPNIFIKGKHVGGFDDFEQAHKDGTVQKLLA